MCNEKQVIYVVYLGDGFGTPTGSVEGHSVLCGLFQRPFKGSLYSKDPGSFYRMYRIMLFVFLIAHMEMCFFLTVGANPKQLD